jgi:hypothetical protein
MNRSIGDSVNRSRSRPGIALDGTIGAAAATEMPTVKTTLATQSCKAIVLRPQEIDGASKTKQASSRLAGH